MNTEPFIDLEDQPEPLADEVNESAQEQPRAPDGTYAARESDDVELDAAPNPETDEVPAEDGESDESSDELSAESDDSEPEPPKRGIQQMQERISRLTAQKKAAEAQAEMLRSQLQQYQPPQINPDLEYEDPGAFTQQSIKSALAEEKASAAAMQAQQAEAMAQQMAQEVFNERLDSMRDEMPDFDDVFNESVPISPVAAQYLFESDLGPKAAYHLAKNTTEARRINRLPPVQQIAALAKLETKLEAAPAKRQTSAPRPPKKVSGGANPQSRDPQKMSMEEYRKFREGAGA